MNPRIEIRPWIQDFQDYAFDYRTYTPAEIRRQMDGVRDAGGRGWLLWDPAVHYTKEALVSARPAFMPNAAGQVPVLAYQDVAPDVLRRDLEWLLAQGFYPTTVYDVAAGGLHGVPAGRKPVVLTFDGALPSQFKLLEGGRVDPASAAGVLLDFAAAHPADFPARGTFFVPLGSDADTAPVFGAAELASFKLQTLVSWGFEIGLMPTVQASAEVYTSEQVTAALGAAKLKLAPLLPDYQVKTIALGAKLNLKGSSEGSEALGYVGAVVPDSGLATSPLYPGVDSYAIPRLAAGAAGTSWRDAIEAAEVFVSGGE